MRFLTDGEKACVFFCDRCAKRLERDDPFEVVISDIDQFIDDAQAGRDRPEQCELLCEVCHEQEGSS